VRLLLSNFYSIFLLNSVYVYIYSVFVFYVFVRSFSFVSFYHLVLRHLRSSRPGAEFLPVCTNRHHGKQAQATRIVFCGIVVVNDCINKLPPAQFRSGHAHTLNVVARASAAQQLSTIVKRVYGALAGDDAVRTRAHAMKCAPSTAATPGRNPTSIIRALMRDSASARSVSLCRGRCHLANPRGRRRCITSRSRMTVLRTMIR